ncbi:hypothetical protein SDC9_194002 [bioreactor metagenome]|uniref:Uncharacterized protein n=1 Tax=bioreactor metagenome TaxID=1076179 RepID=A0A645I694_9ZZZZ
MGPLLRRLAEQDAVVGNNPHRHAVELGKTTHQRGAVARLELVEARAIDDTGNDFAHIEGLAGVAGNDAVDLFRVVQRRLALTQRQIDRLDPIEIRDDATCQIQGMGVALGKVVGHAGQARVHIATTKILGAHDLASGRLHQRRPPKEDGALIPDDDGLVRHGRNIGPPRRA